MKKNFIWLFLTYLRLLAKIQLWKIKPKIIGITGTAGKTSTAHAIEAILNNHFRLKVSHKANSETGLPLNILGLQMQSYTWLDWLRVALLAPIKILTNWQKYDIYLAEMGIDSPFPPKNMGYLLTIFKPNIGVFLNAQPLHSFNYDILIKASDPKQRRQEATQLIAQEKGKMITALPKNGTAVLNTDDINVFRFKDLTQARVIGFGQNEQAQVKIRNIEQSLEGTNFKFEFEQEKLELTLNELLLPDHYAYSFAAALSVAVSLKINIKEAAKNLQQNFKLPPGRATLIKGLNNSYILDSSYNASTQPVIDALKLIDKVSPGRKLALLGDLRELGQETKLEHEKVARAVAETCDRVVLVGPAMKKYVLPILKQAEITVDWVQTADDAAEMLKQELKPSDMLLVKSSQNTLLLEIAVEKLMAEPEKAEKLLCRRGEYWDKRRAELRNPNKRSTD
jgi:UDP-N-acetylmuramoyl-tripeptide--D-alanyl-D-alanine ligase